MRKIFDGSYKRLDDDVSFQIIRTNPRLTTNTKLMYDGENMFFESYDANELLTTQKYKNKRVWKSGLFNNDIRNFLLGTGTSAYDIGRKMADTIIGDDYSKQFENMYWCGAEEINSYVYPQELGIIAPLYLRRKLPNYFVIFKIDGPSNYNMNQKKTSSSQTDDTEENVIDNTFDFNDDILNKSTIVKSFDLREGTVLGDYIRKYTSQLNFKYDKPMYVNFSTHEIYYYGIDRESGLLTQKVENFEKELTLNDNTILHSDDWITNGYYRNNLIYPYIINLEFLFDDNESDEYKFCRYYGYYCDDIDLFQCDDINNDITIANRNYTYYIKDKYENLHTLQKYIIHQRAGEFYFLKPDVYDDYKNNGGTAISRVSDFKVEMYNEALNAYYDIFGGSESDSDSDYTYNNEYVDIDSKYTNFRINNKNISEYDHFNFADYKLKASRIDECSLIIPKIPTHITNLSNKDISEGMVNITDHNVVSDDEFSGYCKDTISIYCNYKDGLGYASYMFSIDKKFSHGDVISLYDNNGKLFDFHAEDTIMDCDDDGNVRVDENGRKMTKKTPNVYFESNRFSCSGSLSDTARSLCKCINAIRGYQRREFIASNVDNIVIIKSAYSGDLYNDVLSIRFSNSIDVNNKITRYSVLSNDRFSGGTAIEGTLFTVRRDDINHFIGEESDRYIKTPDGVENARIISYSYDIDEFNKIDDEYYTIVTDYNGKYVKISDIKQVEILDKFYPNVGVLSFYPVKDFDFDTIYSTYCDNTMFENEIKLEDKRISGDVDGSEYSNKSSNITFSSHFPKGLLFNDDNEPLVSEYDYYYENLLPSLCTVSKTIPYITKWGYVDCVDSCENPYRLNVSKIFGVNNLSSNMFVPDANPYDFTHSMPYYLYLEKDGDNIDWKNEYQYIKIPNNIYNNTDGFIYSDYVNLWYSIFENEEVNNFDYFFRRPEYSKRFSKKYSKFKNGSLNSNPSTLFRGVKFEAVELVENKKSEYEYIEKKSSKYNEYDFSFVYIPIYIKDYLVFNNRIYFVKNDKFKFIVGFILCNMFDDKSKMNKSYIYGGCLDCYNINDKLNDGNRMSMSDFTRMVSPQYGNYGLSSGFFGDGSIRRYYFRMRSPIDDVFAYDKYDNCIYIGEMRIISPIIKLIVSTLRKMCGDCSIGYITFETDNKSKGREFTKYESYSSDEVYLNKYNVNLVSSLKGDRIFKDDPDENVYVNMTINYTITGCKSSVEESDKYYSIMNELYSKVYTLYNNISTFYIKDIINNRYNVSYNSKDFRMKVIEPTSVDSYDIFRDNITTENLDNNTVMNGVEIILKKNIRDMYIKILNRYSGYYNPIFRDIIFFDDMKMLNVLGNYEQCKFSNTMFQPDYSDNIGSFGIIRNMYFHKINEDKNNTILTKLEPYYPLSGQYALDYRDYNIYNSNWDMKYYTKQLNIADCERCNYIASVDNGLCMFGSKYMNVPERISINLYSGFNGCRVWNDDFINDETGCDEEVMYKEVNYSDVNYYLFLRKRIIRYFCELNSIRYEFDKYITSEYSYGLKNTLDDDIEKYVENNILKLYKIDKIRLYVKSVVRGINDIEIENNYTKYVNLSENELVENGFVQTKSFKIEKINSNDFDRNIVYKLRNGFQEFFAFGFDIVKK